MFFRRFSVKKFSAKIIISSLFVAVSFILFGCIRLKYIIPQINRPTLFCFILTSPKNFYTKTTTIHLTWATQCDNFKFVSVIPKLYLNRARNAKESIEVDQPFSLLQPYGLQTEIYKKLTNKVYATIVALYMNYNYYDWYLKADDDTFIFVDNLRDFLANKNMSIPLKFGYNLKTWQSGGAGYVFNNKALNVFGSKLYDDLKNCPNTGTEDQDMSACARKLNVSEPNSIDSSGRELFHP